MRTTPHVWKARSTARVIELVPAIVSEAGLAEAGLAIVRTALLAWRERRYCAQRTWHKRCHVAPTRARDASQIREARPNVRQTCWPMFKVMIN